MIKRFSFTITCIFLIKSIGISQQTNNINSNTLKFVDNKEILLNRFSFNPSHLTDSNKILVDFFLQEQWISSTEPNKGFFLKGETGLLSKNLSIGLIIDYRSFGLFEHRSIIGGAKKKISFNSKSSLDFGLNIGLWQSRMDIGGLILPQPDPLIDGNTVWTGYPILDFGVVYRYKNQNFGLSFKNLIDNKLELQSTDYKLRQNGFIADYQGVYSLSDIFSLIPEIYGCFTQTNRYVIMVGKINYKNILSAGLLYNSENSYGFLISGIIKKIISFGYFFDYDEDKYAIGSHGLNIGLILK